MAIKRAPKGGAYGANREWYKGGQFIATTGEEKGRGSRKSQRKVEVAPYEWRVPPVGMAGIYDRIKVFVNYDLEVNHTAVS